MNYWRATGSSYGHPILDRHIPAGQMSISQVKNLLMVLMVRDLGLSSEEILGLFSRRKPALRVRRAPCLKLIFEIGDYDLGFCAEIRSIPGDHYTVFGLPCH